MTRLSASHDVLMLRRTFPDRNRMPWELLREQPAKNTAVELFAALASAWICLALPPPVAKNSWSRTGGARQAAWRMEDSVIERLHALLHLRPSDAS